MGSPYEGAHSLDEQWQRWASVTEPELSKELFEPSVENHKVKLKLWIENEPSSPLIVGADSKIEALAFLSCIFDRDDFAAAGYNDRAVVFSSAEALRKLVTSSSALIPIVFTEETERELGGLHRKLHTIIVRPKNTVDTERDIVLDLLNHEGFRKALAAMGIDNHLHAEDLARQSGYSSTILRRRLSKIPAIRTPTWTQDLRAVRNLIPMMLVGAWHTQSNADCEVLSLLAHTEYNEIEKQITELLKFDDSPIWSVGQFRGVSSKIDAFFAVQTAVTQKDLDDFLFVAEVVLSESDPALELPEDKRAFAVLYDKKREYSGALREGICETLVLLAVHSNNLFGERLGINVEARINLLIRRLLTPLTPEKLLSQGDDLPLYAEAAPDEFLRIIEEDLKSPKPQVYRLMKPADTGLFGVGFPLRTGLLWALETLAWKPEHLPRVSLILAKLAEQKITDNWSNKPDNSLLSIFRSWMPQTAASLDARKKTLETLTKRSPQVGWQVCLLQFSSGPQTGTYSHRPRWRNDASGAGQHVTQQEAYEFARKALDIVLAWPVHDENTLGDLVGSLQGLTEKDQNKVWDSINNWTSKEEDDSRKGILRECIRRFAFTRRSKIRGISNDIKDRAHDAYTLLTPNDVVIRHRWLFTANWVEESADELESEAHDFRKREERVGRLRVEALEEIWREKGFEGIKALITTSGATFVVGWHLADGVIETSRAADFIKRCLAVDDTNLVDRLDSLSAGFLSKLGASVRLEITPALTAVLPPSQVCRLLKCSPFQKETWQHLDSQPSEIREQYWREIRPELLSQEAPEINEVIDRLLEARRPRAAFQSVQYALDQVETSRLKRLLHEVGTSELEPEGTYELDSYHISSALSILQARSGVTPDEMAGLEFRFIRALEFSDHGIPNLERQVVKSPSLFMQVLALTFRRSDDGEDPPEWRLDDGEHRQAVFSATYSLLNKIQRIPGTDDGEGTIKAANLKAWMIEVRALCLEYGRAKVGDQKIGQILAAAPVGDDGVWPCVPVREVLEEIGSPDIATGMGIGVYNARGVCVRGEGGAQERELAAKYHTWSQQLAFEYPYVSNLVEQIATKYDRQGIWEDSEAAVRRRLRA